MKRVRKRGRWLTMADVGAKLVRCSNGMYYLLPPGETVEQARARWPGERFDVVAWDEAGKPGAQMELCR